jgi:hypothetical protein
MADGKKNRAAAPPRDSAGHPLRFAAGLDPLPTHRVAQYNTKLTCGKAIRLQSPEPQAT